MSTVDKQVAEGMEIAEGETRGVTRKLEPGAEAAKPQPRRAETRKLEPDLEASLQVTSPPAFLGLTREEMNWAALAHGSVLITLLLGVFTGGLAVFLGPIIPAVIWYAFRDRSSYVTDQARQATIFQIAGILALLVLTVAGAVVLTLGWVVGALLVIILVGLLLLPVMLILTLLWGVGVVLLPIAQVVYGCYAAVEAYSGRPFRYRWIADLIDRYESQA